MADIEHSIIINAPRDKVWQSWDRFGEIARFNKGLRASRLLPGSPETGTGARRRCDLKNGKSYLTEEIGVYVPGRQMEVVVIETNLPVQTVRLMLTLTSPTPDTTKIEASANFTMKYGPIGRVLKLVARKGLAGDVTRLLAANKQFNEAA